MKFGMNPSPYYRSKRSTTQIMLELFIGLAVIWICSIVFNFVGSSTIDGVRAIVNPIITMVVAVVTEALFMLPKHIKEKGNFKGLMVKLLKSYGYISGLILALLLPVATSYYAIIISTIFAVAVGKMLFGGFGYNIFNPAIVGRIFCQTCFLSNMKYTADATVTTGATVTSVLGESGWSLEILDYKGFKLTDILLGNYQGALGETFTIVILVVGIVLMLRKVIDWRAPVFYLGSIFIASFFMGLAGGYGLDSFEYALVQISVGGIMFGAVFCITDPVTSPTSPAGRVIFALGAALVTMLIRVFGSVPEGVAYSILIMNALTPLIDASIKGLSNQHMKRKIITSSVMGALVLTSGIVAGATKIEKGYIVNYKENLVTETGKLKANITKLGDMKYQVAVTGNLGVNETKEIGEVAKLFESELQSYQEYFTNKEMYSKANYALSSKGVLQIVYTKASDKKKETITVQVDGKDFNVSPVIENGKYFVGGKDTGISAEEYPTVYATAIEKNVLKITFATDHTKDQELFLAYSTMTFNISIDYYNRTVNKTEFVSTSAVGDSSGGMGDKLLNYEGLYKLDENGEIVKDANGNPVLQGFASFMEYYPGGTKPAKEFYEKYIKVDSPVSFDEYLGHFNDSFIEVNEEVVKTNVTYSANGYMFMVNKAIEYAKYDQTIGKVK